MNSRTADELLEILHRVGRIRRRVRARKLKAPLYSKQGFAERCVAHQIYHVLDDTFDLYQERV